jgi:hypothetical protein
MLLENAATFENNVSNGFGIYVYQTFAERFKEQLSELLPSDDLQVLLNGPDDPFYFDAACNLLPIQIKDRMYFEDYGDVNSLAIDEYNSIDWES